MESIHVIKGKGEASREKANVLLESALNVLGTKYESIILKTVKEVYFYERGNDESINEIMKNIESLLDIKLDSFKENRLEACYFLDQHKNRTQQFIITFPGLTDRDYHIFAHELFGHALCGKLKPMIEKEEKLYRRNGVSIFDGQKSYYDTTNEGFMEEIASKIVAYTKTIQDEPSKKFALARYCANQIFRYLGQETVLDCLIMDQGNLGMLYNGSMNNNDWDKLDEYLKRQVKYQDITHRTSKYLNKEIRQNIRSFQKRKSK